MVQWCSVDFIGKRIANRKVVLTQSATSFLVKICWNEVVESGNLGGSQVFRIIS
jgi:hypothetical protein